MRGLFWKLSCEKRRVILLRHQCHSRGHVHQRLVQNNRCWRQQKKEHLTRQLLSIETGQMRALFWKLSCEKRQVILLRHQCHSRGHVHQRFVQNNRCWRQHKWSTFNPSVTLGWQDKCGLCFESSVAKNVKLFCSDINVIAEDTSIKDLYKITDVGDSINGALNPSVTFGWDRTNAGLVLKAQLRVNFFYSLRRFFS